MSQINETKHQQTAGDVTDFDDVCRLALERLPDASDAEKRQVVEDLWLRFHFGGEYVALIDNPDPAGHVRQPCERLLAHSANLAEVQQFVDRCRPDERTNVVIDYADPIGNDLDTPPNVSQR